MGYLMAAASSRRTALFLPVLAMVALAIAALSFLATASSSFAATAPPPLTQGWTQVATDGFNDPGNTHVPFTVEFRGRLYVSTMAAGQGRLYSGSEKMGGDIWRTADGVEWEQLGTAGLGNPMNSMFDLVVFKDRLYALSYNTGNEGMEVWVSSDGNEFTRLSAGGFDDTENDHAVPFVFADRLILAVSNSDTGVQIWVSDDGESFQQVVSGGLGVAGTTGALRYLDPMNPQFVFKNMLYVGISNPAVGGELWRTSDGLEWERAADGGLGRATSVSLAPGAIYGDQLYVFGEASGKLEDLKGFELFRSSDGTTWQKVVEDGFSMGTERNVVGTLAEFNNRLLLTTSNTDPRILVPGNPTERHEPQGFQVWESADGSDWLQVGEDGFGIGTSFAAGTNLIGGTAYLDAVDYHTGNSLWSSADGEDWQIIFQNPEPDPFTGGGGVMEFQGHLLWISNDLEKGLEIWITDDLVVTADEDTADESSTTTVSGAGTETTTGGVTDGGTAEGTTTSGDASGGGAGQENASDNAQAQVEGGLSGAWLALIVVLAVIALAGIGTTAYLLGRMHQPKQ